jgi:hypothetical protein
MPAIVREAVADPLTRLLALDPEVAGNGQQPRSRPYSNEVIAGRRVPICSATASDHGSHQ